MKLSASVKRIVWALGWSAVSSFDALIFHLNHGNAPNILTELVMLSILIIPLFYFKDDK